MLQIPLVPCWYYPKYIPLLKLLIRRVLTSFMVDTKTRYKAYIFSAPVGLTVELLMLILHYFHPM